MPKRRLSTGKRHSIPSKIALGMSARLLTCRKSRNTIAASQVALGMFLITSTFAGGASNSKAILLTVCVTLAAIIGVTQDRLMTGLERTQELGTFLCLGGTPRFIFLMSLFDTLILGIAGSAVGFLFGLAASLLAGHQLYWLGLMIICGFFITITSLSGLYPAWRASKIAPVEALRTEV